MKGWSSLLSTAEVLKGYLGAHLDCNLIKMLGLKWLSESGGVLLEGSLEEMSSDFRGRGQ